MARAARFSSVPPIKAAVSSPTSKAFRLTNHEFFSSDELAEVDGGAWLTDDLARHATTQVLVDLGLHRVDDLQLVAAFERLEIAVEPLADDRVAGSSEHLPAKARSLEYGWHIQDGVLGATPAARVLGAHGFVGFEERQHGEAEGVLHARPPVPIELTAEDA
jgi:hypothetical protein